MRRSAWIFLAAILLPSLVLAFLAVRSARDQQVILQHQQAIISQDITDALAKKVQDEVDNSRAAFVQATDQLLQKSASPQSLAMNFNRRLQASWDLAELGFSVDLRGMIYSPSTSEGTLAKTFRTENDRFLSNRENVEVFAQNAGKPPPKMVDLGEETQGETNTSPGISPQTPPQHQTTQSNSQNAAQTAEPQAQQATANKRAANQTSNGAVENQNTQGQRPNSHSGQSSAPAANGQNRSNAPPLEPQRGLPQQNAAANQSVIVNSEPQVQMAGQQSQKQDLGQSSFEPVSKQSTAKKAPERRVEPQANFGQMATSNSIAEESDFRRVIGNETSGALARFLEDSLRLMVWYRPRDGTLVFGAQIMQQKLVGKFLPLLNSPDLKKTAGANAAYCLAILDDRGKPVLLSRPGFTADWKHPFVATEIGEALPHWESALYLLDPGEINRSASTLQLALALIVAVLMAAILLGGWLMAADVRRQIRLAQQKTDFVSNVSHELKTPLTSIRMFADMLAEGRVHEQERQRNYLRIIAAESARLTRLINNVLDFARMERGAPSGEPRPCDLVEVAREVESTCRPHLEAVGIPLTLDIESEELPLNGDRDALAQILLNLISNAEKYGGKEILVRVRREGNGAGSCGCVDVLDRGPGIPAKKRETIFEPFQRLDDSLASGVTGSGLGLTLARRMARAHGGDVTYAPRPDGGSCFTLSVPLQALVKAT
jgi:signal transduction histidine kinase/HAMP domain-containing protein